MHSFELRPNSSLTPRAAAWFYGSLVAVLMGVAVVCAALGFWPVLPFAGLEAAVLLGAVIGVQRRAATREYVRVDAGSVVVEKWPGGPWGKPSGEANGQTKRVVHAFRRPGTRVELRGGRPAHWPSRLLFSSQGRSVEIGAFLTEGERHGLKNRLADLLAEDALFTGRPTGRN